MTGLSGDVFLADEFPDIFCGFSIGSPGLARLALGLGRDDGLAGGRGGLEVDTMIRLPGNVVLVGEFPDILCGFFIGSPALTRLALGLGRNDGLQVSRAASMSP